MTRLELTRPDPTVPAPLRLPLLVIAALSALVVIALATIYAGNSTAGEVDRDARATVADALPDSRDGALAVDHGGEPVGLALLLLALVTVCLALRRRRLALLAVLGVGLSILVTSGLKHLAGRTINGGYLSYPSGHTASATALALVFGLLVVGRLTLGAAAAFLMVLAAVVVVGAAAAWSQITLNAHYPTDTLGGFCTAVAVVPLIALLLDRGADPRGGSSTGRL